MSAKKELSAEQITRPLMLVDNRIVTGASSWLPDGQHVVIATLAPRLKRGESRSRALGFIAQFNAMLAKQQAEAQVPVFIDQDRK